MTRLGADSMLADERIEAWLTTQRARKERETTGSGPFGSELLAEQAAPPLITVARQIGCGGEAVARKVAELMGTRWQVWDHEIVEAIAHSAFTGARVAEAIDERVSSAIDDSLRDAFALQHMDAWGFQYHLKRVLAPVARQGYKILVGRGAHLLLPGALHVYIHAGQESRIRNLMAERALSRVQAMHVRREADQEREAFLDTMAHKHSGAFDLTVNTDRLSVDAAAVAIVCVARAVFAIHP